MTLSLTLPDNHELHLSSGSPTKDGSRHWRAWVRADGDLDLRGGDGWSAQEAIDRAIDHYRRTRTTPRPSPLAGLKLNLNLIPRG